ncbi:hypothetical protein GCM10020221_33770 [Streptomyces thioluteus]|uniref:Uncharacterized protein n=1 Tax=Streptomyces thioluteus TaxID=66431 RepID=A0ABP6JMV9_STRTU
MARSQGDRPSGSVWSKNPRRAMSSLNDWASDVSRASVCSGRQPAFARSALTRATTVRAAEPRRPSAALAAAWAAGSSSAAAGSTAADAEADAAAEAAAAWCDAAVEGALSGVPVGPPDPGLRGALAPVVRASAGVASADLGADVVEGRTTAGVTRAAGVAGAASRS